LVATIREDRIGTAFRGPQGRCFADSTQWPLQVEMESAFMFFTIAITSVKDLGKMEYEGCRNLDDRHHKNGAVNRPNVTRAHALIWIDIASGRKPFK
jgi:hypothetical protein